MHTEGNEKKIVNFAIDKLKDLNHIAAEQRKKVHYAQIEEYEMLTKEITKLEKRLSWARFIFIGLFAVLILAGAIVTLVASAGTGSEVAGFSMVSELALYQSVTYPMANKIKDLDNRRKQISDSWIKDKENIARTFGNESKLLNDFLTNSKEEKQEK